MSVAVPAQPGRVRLALRQIATNILHATAGRDVLTNNSPDGWEVEQPWLWWANSGQTVFGNPIPGAGGSQFGSIPAVSRATNLIVDTLSTLPWHVYRDDTDRLPTPDWIADPQGLRLDGRVVDPNTVDQLRMSAVDFWGQWILSALWWGDGFVYAPNRDATGAPKPPMWILHPADVALENGGYWVTDIELDPATVIHLRGKLPIVEGRGTGVLERFAGELGIAWTMRDYVAGAFTAGVPAGYLKTSAPKLTQDQADELKTRWMTAHGSSARRSIAVLNATTEFHPLTWSPVDLAAVDFSRITLGNIALMFDEPAYILGAPTDSNTYANVESRQLELFQLTWLPWIKRVETVLDAQFPRGTELRIVVDGILRADTITRYQTYAIAIDKGILTVDEVRALEARPPLEQPDTVGVA